ncbi:MAG: segregation/condensation protein A [Thermoplasmata archaeon]
MELEILKKLISFDEYDESKIEEYLKLIANSQRGLYHSMKDDQGKAIVAAFELVIEHGLNPWSLDILEFTKLYLEKVKNEEFIDFITAGNLIFMAWQILEKKTKSVLVKYEEKEPVEEIEPYTYDNDYGDYDLTDYLIRENPLQEPVRREEKRPVTIIELINALQKSMNDQSLRKETQEKNKKLNETLSKTWNEKLHRERLEEEIKTIWNRILSIDKDYMELKELYDGSKLDFIQTFIPLLYLYKEEKVNLIQNKPYDTISVEVLVPYALRKLEHLESPKVELITS